MGRLAAIDPSKATGRTKEIFEGPLKGKHFNIFRAMGNSPAALDVYLGMAGALSKASLSDREREGIQLAVGQANNCGYCVAAHTAIGKSAGLSEAQTIEARRGKLADAKLDALAKFALALVEKKGFVSNADLEAVRKAGYNDGHIAEAVATFALAVYTNVFNHVNDTAVDFPAAPAI